MAERLRTLWPALVALAVASAYASWRLAAYGWDPVALAEPGTRYELGDLAGTEGYDGQFVYYIATIPEPGTVASHLDAPAYRYQRVLYPFLARLLAFGRTQWIPWTLLLVNLTAHFAGTWAVAKFLADVNIWPGYALAYGLWVGLVSGVGLDLTEPLAFALIAWGWLARRKGHTLLGAVLLGLSLFAKETSLLFWMAALMGDLLERRGLTQFGALLGGGIAFAVFQVWLWVTFGEPGLASGGAMATPFELIPFMGLWRIGQVAPVALAAFALVFGPSVVLPSVWGVAAAVKSFLGRVWSAEAWALLLSGAATAFLPFSTFREPLGLVRFSTGLMLSILLFSALQGYGRPLRYGLFWIALLAMLVRR